MVLSSTQEKDGEYYVKEIYSHIIYLGLSAHILYIFIFLYLAFPIPMVYNIGSALFYITMLILVKKGCYQEAVTAIHLEVCVFVMVCTVMVGWDFGVYFFLIAISSLVYFCPFKCKNIPYLFSFIEIITFFGLRFYTSFHAPYYTGLTQVQNSCLYFLNASACFVIIIYAAFLSDVSATVTRRELQDENKSLSELANFDQLTGLLTRYSFYQKIEEQGEKPYVLAMGDLDLFKNINDTYGHNCGDFILREIAEMTSRQFRDDAFICRWGGEEFLIFFPAIPMEEVKSRILALCKAIDKKEFYYKNKVIHITMTFGIQENNGSEGVLSTIEKADKRLYWGKNHGRNNVISEDKE